MYRVRYQKGITKFWVGIENVRRVLKIINCQTELSIGFQ